MPFFALVLSWFTSIGGLIFGGLSAIFVWLASSVAKKLLINGLIVSSMIALYLAAVLGMFTLLGSVSSSMPEIVQTAYGLFLPSNTSACIAACTAARLTAIAYAWSMHLIKVLLQH